MLRIIASDKKEQQKILIVLAKLGSTPRAIAKMTVIIAG